MAQLLRLEMVPASALRMRPVLAAAEAALPAKAEQVHEAHLDFAEALPFHLRAQTSQVRASSLYEPASMVGPLLALPPVA